MCWKLLGVGSLGTRGCFQWTTVTWPDACACLIHNTRFEGRHLDRLTIVCFSLTRFTSLSSYLFFPDNLNPSCEQKKKNACEYPSITPSNLGERRRRRQKENHHTSHTPAEENDQTPGFYPRLFHHQTIITWFTDEEATGTFWAPSPADFPRDWKSGNKGTFFVNHPVESFGRIFSILGEGNGVRWGEVWHQAVGPRRCWGWSDLDHSSSHAGKGEKKKKPFFSPPTSFPSTFTCLVYFKG